MSEKRTKGFLNLNILERLYKIQSQYKNARELDAGKTMLKY